MKNVEMLYVEFVEELIKLTPEKFLRFKLMFLAGSKDRPYLIRFLHTVFEIAERYRPKLIEMKEGVTTT